MKQARIENWINLFLGFVVFITPWLFTIDLSPSIGALTVWNYRIVGTVVLVAAALALQDLKPWEEWVNLVLGVWLLLSPWILGYASESGLLWASTILGLMIAGLAAMALPEAQRLQEQRRHT